MTDLSESAIRAGLATERLGRPVTVLPSCGSTSDTLATKAAGGAKEGAVVAAEEQTAGRGRRGRAWHSPAGKNLYFSLLLRPDERPERMGPLTLLAGVALARALGQLGFSPRLKWPNDVLLSTKVGWRKVAGILAEMSTERGRIRHVVLGVGVNVNLDVFPPELADRATSLFLISGAPQNRSTILSTFLNAFEPIYDELLAHGPSRGLAQWQEVALLGQACFAERGSERVEGVAVSVDDGGALLVRAVDGRLIPIHAGEVNWLSPV